MNLHLPELKLHSSMEGFAVGMRVRFTYGDKETIGTIKHIDRRTHSILLDHDNSSYPFLDETLRLNRRREQQEDKRRREAHANKYL